MEGKQNTSHGGTIERTVYQTCSDRRYIRINREIDKERLEKKAIQRICITNYSPNEYEELVFLDGYDYQNIYGVTNKDDKHRSRAKVVKITNPANGKSVHRLFRTNPQIRNMADYAAITYNSICQITENGADMHNLQKVILSKGCIIPFYWNHPNPATRVSMRMGVYSIVIGLVAIVMQLFGVSYNS